MRGVFGLPMGNQRRAIYGDDDDDDDANDDDSATTMGDGQSVALLNDPPVPATDGAARRRRDDTAATAATAKANEGTAAQSTPVAASSNKFSWRRRQHQHQQQQQQRASGTTTTTSNASPSASGGGPSSSPAVSPATQTLDVLSQIDAAGGGDLRYDPAKLRDDDGGDGKTKDADSGADATKRSETHHPSRRKRVRIEESASDGDARTTNERQNREWQRRVQRDDDDHDGGGGGGGGRGGDNLVKKNVVYNGAAAKGATMQPSRKRRVGSDADAKTKTKKQQQRAATSPKARSSSKSSGSDTGGVDRGDGSGWIDARKTKKTTARPRDLADPCESDDEFLAKNAAAAASSSANMRANGDEPRRRGGTGGSSTEEERLTPPPTTAAAAAAANNPRNSKSERRSTHEYKILRVVLCEEGPVGMHIFSDDATDSCVVGSVVEDLQASRAGVEAGDIVCHPVPNTVDLSTVRPDDVRVATYDEVVDWASSGRRPLVLTVKRRVASMTSEEEGSAPSTKDVSSRGKQRRDDVGQMGGDRSSEDEGNEDDDEEDDPCPECANQKRTGRTGEFAHHHRLCKLSPYHPDSVKKRKQLNALDCILTNEDGEDSNVGSRKKAAPTPKPSDGQKRRSQDEEESTPGVAEEPLVPFCNACNSRSKMAPHHALCPRHPEFHNSGASAKLKVIRKGVKMGCRACKFQFDYGRFSARSHIDECERSKKYQNGRSSGTRDLKETVKKGGSLGGSRKKAHETGGSQQKKKRPSITESLIKTSAENGCKACEYHLKHGEAPSHITHDKNCPRSYSRRASSTQKKVSRNDSNERDSIDDLAGERRARENPPRKAREKVQMPNGQYEPKDGKKRDHTFQESHQNLRKNRNAASAAEAALLRAGMESGCSKCVDEFQTGKKRKVCHDENCPRAPSSSVNVAALLNATLQSSGVHPKRHSAPTFLSPPCEKGGASKPPTPRGVTPSPPPTFVSDPSAGFSLNSDDPTPKWVPCANPWGTIGHEDGDFVLFSPCTGQIGHPMEEINPSRFVMEPFGPKSSYNSTHSTPSMGYCVLRLVRDRMCLRPWGFTFRHHEFGGACLVSDIEPMSPAEAASDVGGGANIVGRSSGLHVHDMIICANGKPVGGMSEIELGVELDVSGSDLILVISRCKVENDPPRITDGGGSWSCIEHTVDWHELGQETCDVTAASRNMRGNANEGGSINHETGGVADPPMETDKSLERIDQVDGNDATSVIGEGGGPNTFPATSSDGDSNANNSAHVSSDDQLANDQGDGVSGCFGAGESSGLSNIDASESLLQLSRHVPAERSTMDEQSNDPSQNQWRDKADHLDLKKDEDGRYGDKQDSVYLEPGEDRETEKNEPVDSTEGCKITSLGDTVWECHKCQMHNPMSRKRCRGCMAWRFGNSLGEKRGLPSNESTDLCKIIRHGEGSSACSQASPLAGCDEASECSNNWEDDDEPWLGCVCGVTHPAPTVVFWIQCDLCQAWYNVAKKCIGFSEKEAEQMDNWSCWACKPPEDDEQDQTNDDKHVEDDENSECTADDKGVSGTPESLGRSAPYPVGTLVDVAKRTWPGSNKLGGIGKILGYDGEGQDLTYDISYVLGGKDFGVKAKYVTLQEDDCGARTPGSTGTRSSRRRRHE